MNWIDYREKLGIGFSDTGKAKILSNKVSTFICHGRLTEKYSNDDYYRFCLMTGIKYSYPYPSTSHLETLFTKNNLSIPKIISYYVAFVNTQTNCEENHRKMLIEVLGEFLDDVNIPFEILWDEEGGFVFPKGAKEFDDALVSEPLEWLKEYPQAHKTYCIALKQYSDGIYIRDVADNLRKTLETFLQEFLGNSKNLETNKNDICKYLGEQGVDAGILGLYQPLINAYKNINDRIAKHNDAVDQKLLEFLLYQTGVLIRMVISIKKSEDTEDAN